MTKTEITHVVQWCRSNFLRDGAEGESVHALCDYIDKLHETHDSNREACVMNGACFEIAAIKRAEARNKG